jgi:DnaA family protein
MMQQLLLQLAPPPAPTLDNFVPGRNGAALQALRDIACGAGGERFVYLWGGPGSGRSHLLRGLVRAARGGSGMYLCGTPGGRMAAGHRIAFDDGIAANDGIAVDAVIAVDNVPDLPAADQIELFDLYNRVRAGAGALVASGDAAPAQLALREDLRSRLAWGLAFQLHPLSDEEKAGALREHARGRALELPEDVVAYLLSHARRDMASLIGILDALDRYSLEQKRPVTLPLVKNALETMKDKPA